MTKCREGQLELLERLADPRGFPCAVGVHGPPGSGKTHVLKRFFEPRPRVCWVKVDQCLTPRIALQRALRLVLEAYGAGGDVPEHCENCSVFCNAVAAAQTPTARDRPVTLVLDRVDSLREYAQEMFAVFSRLPDLYRVRSLQVVFVYSSLEPLPLVSTPVPHVYFPRYTVEEATAILQGDEFLAPPAAFAPEFLRVCVVALSPYTGTDPRALKRVAQRIWPRFVDGAGDDFAAQYARKADLFRSEGFVDRLPASQTLALPVVARYMVCAAYLASYNPPRYDGKFFSHAKDARGKRRQTQARKAAKIPAHSLAAPSFDLERFLAIFHALLPDSGSFIASVRTYSYLADLTAQGLITRHGTMSHLGDPVDSRTKWKVNVSYAFADQQAQSLGFRISDYMDIA